ncbi:hypothetical protein IFM89_012610 [Coptis chinensis]|uniref:BHLH domain-containing protein n=1 Tax=Coptis chinensis TaxID=261450 RepID=A0A835IPH3_9MAGN|nr:hypothetical protein IFM89_012610 [Coptis chinensis]
MKESAAATPRAKPSTSVRIDAKERHKLGERERRKEMRELVLSLHSLLPHSNLVKKEQSSVLSELIKYLPLASARLQSLQEQRDSVRSVMTTDPVVFKETSLDSGDSDIRIMAELSSSVSIRVRGDRVTISLSYAQGTLKTLSLSAALDELEAHQLQLIRATHCHDGSKMLLHYESKRNLYIWNISDLQWIREISKFVKGKARRIILQASELEEIEEEIISPIRWIRSTSHLPCTPPLIIFF